MLPPPAAADHSNAMNAVNTPGSLWSPAASMMICQPDLVVYGPL
jgi:hypothetical protein